MEQGRTKDVCGLVMRTAYATKTDKRVFLR